MSAKLTPMCYLCNLPIPRLPQRGIPSGEYWLVTKTKHRVRPGPDHSNPNVVVSGVYYFVHSCCSAADSAEPHLKVGGLRQARALVLATLKTHYSGLLFKERSEVFLVANPPKLVCCLCDLPIPCKQLMRAPLERRRFVSRVECYFESQNVGFAHYCCYKVIGKPSKAKDIVLAILTAHYPELLNL